MQSNKIELKLKYNDIVKLRNGTNHNGMHRSGDLHVWSKFVNNTKDYYGFE